MRKARNVRKGINFPSALEALRTSLFYGMCFLSAPRGFSSKAPWGAKQGKAHRQWLGEGIPSPKSKPACRPRRPRPHAHTEAAFTLCLFFSLHISAVGHLSSSPTAHQLTPGLHGEEFSGHLSSCCPSLPRTFYTVANDHHSKVLQWFPMEELFDWLFAYQPLRPPSQLVG